MNQDGFPFIELGIVLCILGVLAAAFIAPIYTCEAQAEAMKMRHRWALMTGCMVEHKPGQWIPLRQYRVID